MALWSANYSNAQVELDPSQTYNTGNIVVPTTTTSGSTWVGGVYQDGVNCMGGGGPGYCGPNPIVRPDGNINFSYGSVYLYQEQLTAGLLPSITGLQIRGYDFSFTAKNGNGWDDGRVDQLSALVRFWDTTTGKAANNLVYGNSWNLSYRFDWTNFTFSETFNSPHDANSIGRVQYGFIGKDNNFWAGHYGPEIRDVNFNIRYGVDPCASDPMYSPTCPGYFEALQALLPPSVSTPEPVVAVAEVVTAEPVVEQVVQSVPQQTQQQAQQSTQEPTQTAQVVAQPSTQSSTPEEKKESKGGGPSLSTVLSILKNEQDRISGVESKIVEAANEQAQAEADKTVEQAIAIAESSSSESAAASDTIQQAIAASSSSSQQQNDSSSQASGSQLSSLIQQQNSSAASSSAENNTNNITAEALGTGIDPNVILQNTGIQIENRLAPIIDVELPKLDAFKVGATTPADDFLEPKTFSVDQNQSQTNDSVKKPSQTNDLAVGVSFESLATTPAGFNQYNVVMKDVAFYEPKEIYKGQKNVDNVKALRQLASDKLHQEMVEQQYRR